MSNIASSGKSTPVSRLTTWAKARLLARLISRHWLQKAGSLACFISSRSTIRSVCQPSPMVLVMRASSRGLQSASQRRWVTPLSFVVEAFGPQLIEVVEEVAFEQFAMQCGHTVDRKGTDDRQVGHAHMRDRPILDDRQARQSRVLTWPVIGDDAQEARVDLEDDVEDARQQGTRRAGTGHFSSASGSKV